MSEEMKNEVVITENEVDADTGEILIPKENSADDIVRELTEGVKYFSTFNDKLIANDEDAITKLLNAMLTADHNVEDYIGQTIYITDIVSYYDRRENGDILPIFIIFDDKGETYVTGSKGVYNSLKKILPLLMKINLNEKPYGVKLEKVQAKNGKATILKAVGFKKK